MFVLKLSGLHSLKKLSRITLLAKRITLIFSRKEADLPSTTTTNMANSRGYSNNNNINNNNQTNAEPVVQQTRKIIKHFLTIFDNLDSFR